MRGAWVSVLFLLAAGCVDVPASQTRPAVADVEAYAALRRALWDLPCEAEVGAGTSANLRELALAPLDASGAGAHGEMAVFGDLAAVARYGTGGVALADVSDPAAPQELAAWDPEEPDRGLDVKFSPDGRTLLVAGDRAIHLLDVRIPTQPRVESAYVLAKEQAHMLTTFEVGGVSYVSAAKGEGYDLAIYRIEGEPGGRVLVPVAQPRLTLAGEATGEDLLRSHDAWFVFDEAIQKPLLWVANVWDGIVALDVSDPASPVVAARIPNADPYQGYVHTVQTTFLGDRRLVVAVSELGLNALRVYDATDLAAPRLVALWHVDDATRPQHNLQLVGGAAFVAHYEMGTFVFDLSGVGDGPAPSRLAPIARLAASPASGAGPAGPGLGTVFGALFEPGTWDVVVHRGLVYTTEMSAGLRVTAFGCMLPGDPTLSSTG